MSGGRTGKKTVPRSSTLPPRLCRKQCTRPLSTLFYKSGSNVLKGSCPIETIETMVMASSVWPLPVICGRVRGTCFGTYWSFLLKAINHLRFLASGLLGCMGWSNRNCFWWTWAEGNRRRRKAMGWSRDWGPGWETRCRGKGRGHPSSQQQEQTFSSRDFHLRN